MARILDDACIDVFVGAVDPVHVLAAAVEIRVVLAFDGEAELGGQTLCLGAVAVGRLRCALWLGRCHGLGDRAH